MVFHPVLLIIEMVIVLVYVLGPLFLLNAGFSIGLYVFIGLLIFCYFRYLILSDSKKGLRPRRDMIGYTLMLVGPLAAFISFYLEMIITFTGCLLFFSRASYEMHLWVKLIRLGDDYDQELHDMSTGWEAELMGEDAGGSFPESIGADE